MNVESIRQDRAASSSGTGGQERCPGGSDDPVTIDQGFKEAPTELERQENSCRPDDLIASMISESHRES
jgi:hypothetical protein